MDSKHLALKDFWVGKIDGKDAFSDPTNTDAFRAFVLPESVSIERLLDGQSLFVLGLRGTGKTSILRYIANQRKTEADFAFVLFKTDIPETKRRELSTNVWYTSVSSEKFEISQDFKDSWRWFVYFHLASLLHSHGYIKADHQLLELLGIKNRWFKTVLGYFPRLSAGSIEVEAGESFIKAQADLDFSPDMKRVTLESVNRKIETVLKSLKINKKVVLIFDELEVFYETEEQYGRDIRLVRDLLFSISAISDFLRLANVPIYLLAAVRREVLYALGSSGQEIERLVEDRAEKLIWHLRRKSADHPLMFVLRAYLKANWTDTEGEDILYRFFPQQINDRPVEEYILDNSFYKPRDIVARLTAAKDTYPDEERFSQRVLEESMHEYGRILLREVRYELSATYKPIELDLLESLFRSKKPFFSRSTFQERLDEYAKYSSVTHSLIRRSVDTVLRDLYRTGMIGNEWTERGVGRTHRWIFRGEDRLVLERQMVVNRALWRVLAIRQITVPASR